MTSADEWMRWKFFPPAHNQTSQLHIIAYSDSSRGLTSLADDPRVSLVLVQVARNVLPQLPEHECAPGKVQCSEVRVVDALSDDLRRRTGRELDDTGWDACFQENLVGDVVRVGRCGRRLPYDDVSDESRGCFGGEKKCGSRNFDQQSRRGREKCGPSTSAKITANGSKVERRDCKDETLEWSVLNTANGKRQSGMTHGSSGKFDLTSSIQRCSWMVVASRAPPRTSHQT